MSAKVAIVITLTGVATQAQASETITYSYDALGRLVAASHSGSSNSGLQSSYGYDPADNRSNVTVTGASSGTARIIVVPLGGFTIIPIQATQ